MNTLTNAPLADLLQRLFAEAEASAPGDSPPSPTSRRPN